MILKMHLEKEEKNMPRKKKTDEVVPVYVRAGIHDTLTLVSMRTGVEVWKLRELNPKIKNSVFPILYGERVRIE